MTDADIPNVWLLDPVSNAIRTAANSLVVCSLLERGIQTLSLTPKLVKAFISTTKVQIADHEIWRTFIQISEESAGLARDFENLGHEQLRQYTALAIWAACETAFDETATSLLMRSDELVKRLASSSKRLGRHLPFQQDRREAHVRAFLKAMEADSEERNTCLRYIEILGQLGLPISLSQDSANRLYALSEMRNVILHRGGRYDARFVTKLPNLAHLLDTTVTMDRESLLRTYEAASAFLESLLKSIVESGLLATRER